MGTRYRLSVLDRSHVQDGQGAARALRETVRTAIAAERAGYHRFWLSEHHGVPGIAGSAPTVLAAAVAARTERIRIGTGGVMLPNHRPLVVAEQFRVLSALFPGRIDLGVGRSVGFTRAIQDALGHHRAEADDFPAQLAELLEWLGPGTAEAHPHVRVQPDDVEPVPPYVLAMGEGGRIAAAAGLPVVVGGLHDRDRLLGVVAEYRAAFHPSPWCAEPRVLLAAPVAVADTAEAARDLLAPEAWAIVRSRSDGAFPALPTPERVRAAALTPRERDLFERTVAGQIAGPPAAVRAELDHLVDLTGAEEVLVTTGAHDPAVHRATLLRIAEALA
ncbi:MsnO8 family LLM class oxidoreductase [Kitasatospora sp. NPDC096147]|uniref:MsnO8 family LLM class oxidoreductase n=1 Tax=Kitasatospora sp. NPDC096147 TaxID=3364093 RepID=UPI0038069C65